MSRIRKTGCSSVMAAPPSHSLYSIFSPSLSGLISQSQGNKVAAGSYLLPGEDRCGDTHCLTAEVNLRSTHIVDLTWSCDNGWSCRQSNNSECKFDVGHICLD